MVRIARDALLKVRVPIHTVGEPRGVKVQGGIFDFVLREVELECLPDDIPENITVDVSELTLGHNLRVSDLPIGPKVKVLTDPARVVAHVVALKVEEEKPAEVIAEAAPAEPEVIRKGKGETEEGEEPAGTGKAEKKEGKKEGKKE
jgi:large subunit ribosomal protein L25